MRIDPGQWRRTLKGLVEALNPEASVLIGREDGSGHYPVRLSLQGCEETLRLYCDQVTDLGTDMGAQTLLHRELQESLQFLALKVEMVAALHHTSPGGRVTFGEPVVHGSQVTVEIKSSAQAQAVVARAETYGAALRILHHTIVHLPPTLPSDARL